MLIQLVGRQEAENRYAQLEVPSNVIPGGLLKLTLVNFNVCADATHNHFRDPRADDNLYPVEENYQAEIEVRVPRARRVGYSRRSFRFIPYIAAQAPAQQLVEEPDQNRQRRSIGERKKREAEAMSLDFEVKFTHPAIRYTERAQSFGDLSALSFSSHYNAKAVKNELRAFGNFYASTSSLDIVDDRMVLTLPPRTKISFCDASGLEYLITLGFSLTRGQFVEERSKTSGVKYSFSNQSYVEPSKIVGVNKLRGSTKMSALFVTNNNAEYPGSARARSSLTSTQSYTVEVEKLSPGFRGSIDFTDDVLLDSLWRFCKLF